jgi:imidazole glycerol-phosphate synthase subunit HisH
MIAIIDYGAGNLHSVKKAIEFVGGKAFITNDAEKIINANKVILPGVGAFKEGMDRLKAKNLISILLEFAATEKPIIGICLGMQLLFDESEEQGVHYGLGLVNGRVLPFDDPKLKIPQIGWNSLEVQTESPLFYGIKSGDYVYFNHTYFCSPENNKATLSSTNYGINFSSAINQNNVYGVQFHPEKSQKIGLKILKNFVEHIQ